MKKHIMPIRSAFNKLVLMGAIAFAAAFALVPQAHAAEYPNILAGQDLMVGSSGQGVVVLQGLLQELGYMTIPTGVPMGYYGPLTRDGVARYQAALGVSPTAGYFGPATKIAVHQQFMPKGWLALLGW